MKYAHDSAPYEHTCPNCGRHQEVYKYDQDPHFDVGEVEEFQENEMNGIRGEMVVNLEQQFTSVACGYVQNFDGEFIKTDVTGTLEHESGFVEINEAVRLLKRQFRQENEVEEYL